MFLVKFLISGVSLIWVYSPGLLSWHGAKEHCHQIQIDDDYVGDDDGDDGDDDGDDGDDDDIDRMMVKLFFSTKNVFHYDIRKKWILQGTAFNNLYI